MSDEVEDVKTTTESSTEVSGAESTDSPTVTGEAAEGSPAAESKKIAEPNAREKLIAELTTGAEAKEPEKSGDDEKTTDDAPEKDVDVGAAGEDATKSAVTEKPVAAGKQDDQPAPLSEEELTAPVDPRVAPKTKRRIEQLLDERKNREPIAQYGHTILELQKAAGISPEQFGAWTALGMQIHTKPQEAPLRLFAEAKKLAAANGIKLPVEQSAPQGLPDDFDDFVMDQVADGSISMEGAKALREKLKPLRSRLPTQQTPAPAPASAAVTSAPQPTPTQPQIAPEVFEASKAIDKVGDDYAKRYPTDWAKIKPVAEAAMSKYRGTDPKLWAGFFDREVKDAIAKVARPTPKPPNLLRPAGPTSSAGGGKETPRGDVIAELTGRRKS